jgi:formate hydrogenlyase transcriptional activator
MDSGQGLEEIIGQSAPLKRMLEDVRMVAPGFSTVLILGETGTGKELVARAIHRLSSRSMESFVTLNCAALPGELLESELFGYEKGAFTHAVHQKRGRLELANRGTLFMDEIGDLPLEVQPKLLRVLQDHEFERLGGTSTIRVNMRLIAATNRNLARSVSERRFRQDLFYRLNVFPIRVPSLRERSSDIPLLVRHFVQKFSPRMNKKIDTISGEAMTALMKWTWPGNIRELEHFIERAVVLSEGSELHAPIAELGANFELVPEATDVLETLRREHIIKVLRETRGVISGPSGAAIRLGLKRTTLQSMLQRLRITRSDYEE